ncbi:MAG: cupin domain-containing protein [bacterium]
MKANLFADIPEKAEKEIIEILASGKKFRVERIISNGQSTPENNWYDQDESEWVIVVEGGAVIEYQEDEFFEMFPGDYIFIPAHKKHRVKSTSLDEETIWLAFFVMDED